MSYCRVQNTEWRTRKIDVLAVVASFVRQLKPGQDLTKVSLPSVLCFPFSLLELMADRELLTFHLLFELDNEEDPFKRFMIVLKFIVSLLRTEVMHKKPYNPVLGEHHFCYVDNGPGDVTEFISEQVSHHPPVSALHVKNRKHGLSLETNLSFGVTFGGNKAGVVTAGQVVIKTPKDTYEMTKVVPDMSINNVVKGKRYIMWEGSVTLSCPDSGFTANIFAEEDKNKVNQISGTIFCDDDPSNILYEFKGVCGGETCYFKPGKPATKQTLIDLTKFIEATITYLPVEFQDQLDSFQVWSKVNQAIIDNDMQVADAEKKLVEAAQRLRSKAKIGEDGAYFAKDLENTEQVWTFKENLNLVEWLGLDKQKTSPADKPKRRVSHAQSPAPVILPTLNIESSSSEEVETKPEKPQEITKPRSESDPFQGKDVELRQEILEAKEVSRAQSELPKSEPARPRSKLTESCPPLSEERKVPELESTESEGTESDPEADDGEDRSAPTLKRAESVEGDDKNQTKKEKKKQLSFQKKQMRGDMKSLVAKAKEHEKKGSILSERLLMQGPGKIRNSVKKWNDRYLRLYPGKLAWYKGHPDKGTHESGIILLDSGCFVTQRPSKKDGFCIKIFNVYGHPIHSKQDLKGKPFIMKARVGHSNNYCLIRFTDPEEGKKWIKQISLATIDYETTKAFIGNDLKVFLAAEDSDDDDEWDGTAPLEKRITSSKALPSGKSSVDDSLALKSPEKDSLGSEKRAGSRKSVLIGETVTPGAGKPANKPRSKLTNSDVHPLAAGAEASPERTSRPSLPPPTLQIDMEQLQSLIAQIVQTTINNSMESFQERLLHSVAEKTKEAERPSPFDFTLSSSAASSHDIDKKLEKIVKKELAIQESKLAYIIRSNAPTFKKESKEDIVPLEVQNTQTPLQIINAIRSTLPSNGILILLIFYFLWSISSTLAQLFDKIGSVETPPRS